MTDHPTAKDEEKVVVGVSREPNGVVQVVMLVPPPGWDYMQGGLAHTFDLTKWGIPVQFVLGRCTDKADGMRIIEQANDARGIVTVRDLRSDLSIPPAEGK